MYAIVEIAGFDFKVKPGDRISVPCLPNEPGDEVEFSEVKLLKDKEELKFAPKASVKAKVLAHHRGKKVVVYKFKKRKAYRRKLGSRDSLTELEVTSITHKE
jgi:large subunit ribosomal protein L21